MNLIPFASPEGFKAGSAPPEGGKRVWFIFSEGRLLTAEDKRQLPHTLDLTLKRSLYLGALNGLLEAQSHPFRGGLAERTNYSSGVAERPPLTEEESPSLKKGLFNGLHLFAGEVEPATAAPPGWVWSGLRPLFHTLDEVSFSLAGRAHQLLQWDRTNHFCGCCGSEMESRAHERCKECRKCGYLAYPKLSLVTMTLVKRAGKILLARGTDPSMKAYSVIAGFVDPGETLEQCVMREIEEEVGLRVKNVHYVRSQPWPISFSLLTAFTCDWESGEIKIDPSEIEDAGWFDRSNLPEIPSPLSLAHSLIMSALL